MSKNGKPLKFPDTKQPERRQASSEQFLATRLINALSANQAKNERISQLERELAQAAEKIANLEAQVSAQLNRGEQDVIDELRKTYSLPIEPYQITAPDRNGARFFLKLGEELAVAAPAVPPLEPDPTSDPPTNRIDNQES